MDTRRCRCHNHGVPRVSASWARLARLAVVPAGVRHRGGRVPHRSGAWLGHHLRGPLRARDRADGRRRTRPHAAGLLASRTSRPGPAGDLALLSGRSGSRRCGPAGSSGRRLCPASRWSRRGSLSPDLPPGARLPRRAAPSAAHPRAGRAAYLEAAARHARPRAVPGPLASTPPAGRTARQRVPRPVASGACPNHRGSGPVVHRLGGCGAAGRVRLAAAGRSGPARVGCCRSPCPRSCSPRRARARDRAALDAGRRSFTPALLLIFAVQTAAVFLLAAGLTRAPSRRRPIAAASHGSWRTSARRLLPDSSSRRSRGRSVIRS